MIKYAAHNVKGRYKTAQITNYTIVISQLY